MIRCDVIYSQMIHKYLKYCKQSENDGSSVFVSRPADWCIPLVGPPRRSDYCSTAANVIASVEKCSNSAIASAPFWGDRCDALMHINGHRSVGNAVIVGVDVNQSSSRRPNAISSRAVVSRSVAGVRYLTARQLCPSSFRRITFKLQCMRKYQQPGATAAAGYLVNLSVYTCMLNRLSSGAPANDCFNSSLVFEPATPPLIRLATSPEHRHSPR